MLGKIAKAALWGGLIAGALDIAYALITFSLIGKAPAMFILQSIASGVLGDETYKGGPTTALLGLALHFAILIVASGIYATVATRVPALIQRTVLFGGLFGLAVFLVMYFVVLPLSASSVTRPSGVHMIGALLIHAFGVGVPIALVAKRFIGRAEGPPPRP